MYAFFLHLARENVVFLPRRKYKNLRNTKIKTKIPALHKKALSFKISFSRLPLSLFPPTTKYFAITVMLRGKKK